MDGKYGQFGSSCISLPRDGELIVIRTNSNIFTIVSEIHGLYDEEKLALFTFLIFKLLYYHPSRNGQ